jgi:hypothetical protein
MKNISTILAILLPILTFAQPGNPGDGVPIDGGASILLAAGVAYGVKKIHDRKNKK